MVLPVAPCPMVTRHVRHTWTPTGTDALHLCPGRDRNPEPAHANAEAKAEDGMHRSTRAPQPWIRTAAGIAAVLALAVLFAYCTGRQGTAEVPRGHPRPTTSTTHTVSDASSSSSSSSSSFSAPSPAASSAPSSSSS
jgi:hypothetical protein